MRPADLAAGIQVALLRHFAKIEGARVLLSRVMYVLEWRLGYGPLQIAANVTLVGEGAVLSGGAARLEVEAEGVRFESLDLPRGADVRTGGSLTMSKCASTGDVITVEEGARLAMEDTRVFRCGIGGVDCCGKLKLTRCTVEDNSYCGVLVGGEEASAELVHCVIRKNGQDGLVAERAKVTLRGGTVSGNKRDGVVASGEGVKITVSKEQPTICKDNERHDWLSEDGGVLEGVAEENARG